MNKWLFRQNGFTRISLSATATRVSNYVCVTVCGVFLHRQGSPSRWFVCLVLNDASTLVGH